jgi:hypothetical protein
MEARSMNRWLQRRWYQCQACAGVYLHDLAYRHHGFECPERPLAITPRLREAGRTYEPMIGR